MSWHDGGGVEGMVGGRRMKVDQSEADNMALASQAYLPSSPTGSGRVLGWGYMGGLVRLWRGVVGV